MATKKVVKKQTEPTPLTVTVGAPVLNKTITVHGIEFEQGDILTFGKCQYTAAGQHYGAPVLYNFMRVTPHDYILWNTVPGGAYLNYLSERDITFQRNYTIVPFDTDLNPPAVNLNAGAAMGRDVAPPGW